MERERRQELLRDPRRQEMLRDISDQNKTIPEPGELGKILRDAKAARAKKFEKFRFEFGSKVGEIGRASQEQPPAFSQEQDAMREVMSGGQVNKIWGFNNEPVRINNDLNPRRRGDTSTGEMFGF